MNKAIAAFNDPARPDAFSQLVTVLERGAVWSRIRTNDGREFTISTVCLS